MDCKARASLRTVDSGPAGRARSATVTSIDIELAAVLGVFPGTAAGVMANPAAVPGAALPAGQLPRGQLQSVQHWPGYVVREV